VLRFCLQSEICLFFSVLQALWIFFKAADIEILESWRRLEKLQLLKPELLHFIVSCLKLVIGHFT